ncbi:DUF58 domain-containing protein [Exiguobacterium oxidotolerans]|uniref:Uncharacterized protein n=1 Tax=Exiguobacterium oxidotolerans TaxID=223958 RepID=A0A653I5X9_9BACL|nr:DUF58 domain-containing protein [Exiguobacterium oxidotolerans]VWX34406.1 conserved hypothetical protein [Exiguobacterium oxidotolerans]
MNVTSNLFFLISRRLVPLHAVLMIVLLFVPGATPIALFCATCFAAAFYIERYRRRLIQTVRLQIDPIDEILFREERSPLRLSIEGVDELNAMMQSAYIRIPEDRRFTLYLAGESRTIHEVKRLTRLIPLEIEGHIRGPIRLPEIVISINLPLWLGQIVVSTKSEATWFVYPSIDRAKAQTVRTILNLGERKTLHSPLKDRSLQISTIPYQREPSRQIDWYATAKRASLQSKVYQPSTQDTFTIVLDLSSPSGIALHRQFEVLIENTALVARELITNDGKIEVFINRLDSSGCVTHLKLKEGPRQLKRILILLADLSERDLYVGTSRFSSYVDRHKNKQSQRVDIRLVDEKTG